jgi:hypothetical protein
VIYGAAASAGQAIGAASMPAGPVLVAASGMFLAAWYGWRRTRSVAFRGRQISKPLARARRTGPFAYGIVLGTGILTIVSTPAVWLGLGCCLAIGSALWGAVYGVSFGTGRALALLHDARWSRTAAPGAVPMLVVGRRLNPQSHFWLFGAAGGLALTGLALAAYA